MVLRTQGANVTATDLGEEAFALVRDGNFDMVILDLQLPDMHGSEVLRKVRNARIGTPVMILSGTMTVGAKVDALKNGADDFMTKPFHKEELIARVQAVIRRAKGHAQSVIELGKLTVNLDTKTLDAKGERVNLTGKEYQILELLAQRRGSTVSKDALLGHLYGGMDEPEMKIIDVFICKLRKKIAEACDGESYIETVWSRGYMLRAPGSAPSSLSDAA